MLICAHCPIDKMFELEWNKFKSIIKLINYRTEMLFSR